MSGVDGGAEPQREPFLRILSGGPTDEDVAALVAVFAASSAAEPERGPRDDWGRAGYNHRISTGSGPGTYLDFRL